jgi:micrococcal nuclease
VGLLFGPARPPGAVTRALRRVVSARFLVKAVTGVGVAALVLLPMLADLVNAALKPVAGDSGSCRILNVVDGDTVTLMCPEEGVERARILGFDTPEKYSPKCVAEFVAAERAAWALRTLIQKADRLQLRHEGTDQYGRALVRLELDGQDVAGRMVRSGHARTYGGGPRGSWC